MSMMRRAGSLLLGLLLLLSAVPACAATYWNDAPEGGTVCRESRPGCHLLQMAMTGSFAQLDRSDNISVRVFAAVLPQLCALGQEDFDHFTAQFGVDEALVRRIYHIALGNCLLADITLGTVHTPEASAAYRVLLLFLYPQGEDNAAAQKSAIRREMNGEILSSMAKSTGLPADFIAYLMATDEWNVLPEAL